MHSADILRKIRAQLDRNGYKDVEIHMVGDQPWSKMAYNTDIARAITQMYDQFQIPYTPPSQTETILGGAWPGYLFTTAPQGDPGIKPIGVPIAGGGAGLGGMAHAANEYLVIEGAGKIYGMAGAEKSFATILYNYAKASGTTTRGTGEPSK